jgi:hypothetical protein
MIADDLPATASDALCTHAWTRTGNAQPALCLVAVAARFYPTPFCMQLPRNESSQKPPTVFRTQEIRDAINLFYPIENLLPPKQYPASTAPQTCTRANTIPILKIS